MRFLGAVAAALVIALAGAVVPAAPAEASTRVLCVGYDACARAGYSNHGYKPKRHNLYWRMAGDHNCTNYVAFLLTSKGMTNVRPWVGDGNAYAWGDFTKNYRDSTPVVGAVAWWDANRAPASSTGHVSYVEKVISKNEIIVSEDNWKGEFRWKRITRSGGGWPSAFIHFKDSRTPKPAPYSATQVSQSVYTDKSKKTEVVSTALHPGASAWVELVYRNTGSKTWTGVSLATQQPASRASALAAGWSSASKVTRHAETSVKPGGLATFGFAVKIPESATPGTSWVEHFAPRSTSGTWMLQSDAMVLFGANSDVDFASRPRPEITGTAQEGETLSAVAGAWDPAAALSYVWKREGTAIPGAVAATYTPTSSDVGRRLTVTVSARADGFHDSLQTSARTSLVASLTSDTLAVGETLASGEGRISANGVYLLTQRADGNLVIYDRRTMIPLWANAQAGETLSTRFSPTGALNTYTGSGVKKWTSGTTGSKAVKAVLRNDGHLVLYTKNNTKVWSSYTSGR